VRLIYSDESGVGDVRVEPITVVAAIMINADTQWKLIEAEVMAILDLLPPHKRGDEFKGSRLFGQLSKGNNELILRRFLSLIPQFDIPVSVGAVHREGWRRHCGETNNSVAIDRIQDIAFLLSAVTAEHVMSDICSNEMALWIADETRKKTGIKEVLQLFQRRQLLPNNERTQLNHIVDTAYFGDSKESRALQLADACAYFVKQHHMSNQSAERFFQIIAPHVKGGENGPLFAREN
jgi:Protein of unknown function (DUF3800)